MLDMLSLPPCFGLVLLGQLGHEERHTRPRGGRMVILPTEIEIEPQPFAIVRRDLRLWLILPNRMFNHISRGPHTCQVRRNPLENPLHPTQIG